MSECFPKLNFLGVNVKVKLNLSNLKNASGFHTSSFEKKSQFS